MTQSKVYKYSAAKYLLLLTIVVTSMMSWKDAIPTAKTTTERLDIFGVKPDKKEKDSLLYVELLDKSGDKELTKIYYDKSNTEVGKETYLYQNDTALPYGSSYTGPDGKILSYYRYVYNAHGQKVLLAAFDAADDSILRYERYSYDANGHLAIKEISDASLKPNRQFIFENDKFGNINTMTILGENADTIAVETYKTTKMDDKQRWVEKWGFIDDNPKTFHIKSIK